VASYTIEAMMGNGWALQSGTSHFLGQNFAKAFDIKFLNQNNELDYAWTTSWGLSTRMVGAIIMAHGDDQGLMLPPRLAPIQVVIVPIWRKDEERTAVLALANQMAQTLKGAGVRVRLDDRDELSAGFKFNDWELRGVPLRIEIGPRDVQQNAVVLARRDLPGKEGKTTGVPVAGIATAVNDVLATIQTAMLQRATEFRDANTRTVKSYDEFKEVLEATGGFIRAHWAGTGEDEDRIKEETKATIRCFPFEKPDEEGACFYTGQRTDQVAIFARAY
jgi:prolyl-tRNA synthetase